MAEDIIRRQEEIEYRILEAILEESGGNDMTYVEQQTIADKTGIDFAEITRRTGPMMNKGLIKGLFFKYAITEYGIEYLKGY